MSRRSGIFQVQLSKIVRRHAGVLCVMGQTACSAGGPDVGETYSAPPDVEASSDRAPVEVEPGVGARAVLERPSRAEREAEFQRQLNGALSDEERLIIENAFEQAGMARGRLRFTGRTVSYDGNGYQYADDLLATATGGDVTEKGKVLSQITSGTPDLYARQVDATTQFIRPDVSLPYDFIVDDDAPEFVVTMLQAAVNAIANAGSADCLFPGNTLRPIRQSAFDALDRRDSATHYLIDVVYDDLATACRGNGPDTQACAQLPRIEAHTTSVFPPITSERMRLGTRIGIVDSAITADTADNRGALIHEILHTMGVVHPEEDEVDSDDGLPSAELQKIVVHGTEGGINFLSVMHADLSDPNWRNTLQADDTDVLLTLYSNYEDGRGCTYFPGFRTVPFRL